jgi:hypothetical protein
MNFQRLADFLSPINRDDFIDGRKDILILDKITQHVESNVFISIRATLSVRDGQQVRSNYPGRERDLDLPEFGVSSAYVFSWDLLYVNALSISRGRGKMIVEVFSVAISASVPRNLS